MIAIITDSPTAGHKIARIVGAGEKQGGTLQGNETVVTWMAERLVELASAEKYGFRRHGELPFIPESFQLVKRQKWTVNRYLTDRVAARQLGILTELLQKCTSVIAATEPGPAGELAFRYLCEFADCRLPVKRLWLYSLTDEAIYEGMHKLREGSQFDNLYHAAACRDRADWLIGVNVAAALSRATGTHVPVSGLAEIPTLATICSRTLENRHFVPSGYRQLHATMIKDGTACTFRHAPEFRNKSSADTTYKRMVTCGTAQITAVETKPSQESPPLLYDLTALQQDCHTRFGMTARQTFETARALYEKGLISYPCVDARHISSDVARNIPSLLRMILRMEYFSHLSESYDTLRTSRRSIDDTKVADHHSIIITGDYPRDLSADEDRVYHLIAGRMLEAFAPKCVSETTRVEADIDGLAFISHTARITHPGWREVYGSADESEDSALPPGVVFVPGETIPVGGVSLAGRKTIPPPLLTEASLLDFGMGASAARAAIIESLISHEYIERNGNSLIPTGKGLEIYRIVKDMRIADPQLAGDWEKTLRKVETGEIKPETFMKSFEIYIRQTTEEILSTLLPKEETDLPVCPKCRKGGVIVRHKTVKCDNPACGFGFSRRFLGMDLNEEQINRLLIKRKTLLIKGFEGKAGKTFDARLKFDKNFNLTFDFPKPKPKSKFKTKSKSKTGSQDEPTQ